jgi:ABC-type glucose/galactose transport system permease subunit
MLPTASALTALGIALMILTSGTSLTRECRIFLTALSVYIFYVGPMVLLVNPQFRYVAASVLLLITCALMSLRMLVLVGRTAFFEARPLTQKIKSATEPEGSAA